jgi:hypothetical protein
VDADPLEPLGGLEHQELALARVDLEPVVAGQSGDLVGVEPRAVHHYARSEPRAAGVPKHQAAPGPLERDDAEAGAQLRAVSLRRRGEGEGVGVTYVKPESCSTALRVELKASQGRAHASWLARVLSDETPGPWLQEPYAQHQADLWAKSIGVGVDGAIHAMRLAIAGEGDASYLEYLLRSYRTTSTGGRA